jgi:hypothetical protein
VGEAPGDSSGLLSFPPEERREPSDQLGHDPLGAGGGWGFGGLAALWQTKNMPFLEELGGDTSISRHVSDRRGVLPHHRARLTAGPGWAYPTLSVVAKSVCGYVPGEGRVRYSGRSKVGEWVICRLCGKEVITLER